MNRNRDEKFVKDFIAEVSRRFSMRYNNLVIDFEYCNETGEYSIWHNNKELQFNDPDFLKETGRLIKEILFANNIYNFSFGYDHLRAKNIKGGYFTGDISILEKDVDVWFVESSVNSMAFYNTWSYFEKPFIENKNISFISRDNSSGDFDSTGYSSYFSEQFKTYVLYDNKQEERLAA